MDKYTYTLYGSVYFIPHYMRGGLERYVFEGIRPGSFLQAVITNNLHDAFMRADDINFHNIAAYVNFFHNHAPAICWGSRKTMETWIKNCNERRKENGKKETSMSRRKDPV